MTTTRSAVIAGCFLLVLALPGCTITTKTSDANVAGNWSGTYIDGKSNASGAISATFAQSDGSVTGTLTIPGWICSASSQGNVSGSISGNDVQANANFGLVTAVSFSGNASGNQLTGSYSITSGVCSGDSGSFTMSK
jgi:hypothetical protein